MILLSSPSFKRRLSFVTFSLMLLYIFGLINIEHSYLGLPSPLFEITYESKLVFDVIFWIIVCLLALELVIAYIKIRNTKTFLKKYWLEMILLIFMPVFAGFKMLKITLKVLKQIKVGKTAFKIFQKIKKI
ncbi:hypothetical protein [Nitrosopumilus sp.]|uniref:hypothetical protein n=1 Tax=Nitrosopumilus sp. TaxID=2024843 RepID=UPI00247C2E9E|nr:hypothetical protein [Nitrosopumilus sp.]MCV0431689.1 hypothetical protein [Nitrosopumilus sp.]